MGKSVDLTGQKFGRLFVVEKAKKRCENIEWVCRCDCGKTRIVSTSRLRAGTVKSCVDCANKNRRERPLIDITGKRFGKLTVIEQSDKKNGRIMWLTKCCCGNETVFSGQRLRSGKVTSCGCDSMPFSKYTKNQLIQSLRDYVENNGFPTNIYREFRLENGLPDMTNYKKAFGGGLVDWLELCGYKLSDEEKYFLNSRGVPNKLSKAECERIIRYMQDSLTRPLMYDDFRHPQSGSVGIAQIKKYWGTVNKMKKDLGLEINQESMTDKIVTEEVLSHDIHKICNKLNEECRDFLTTKEIDSFSFCSNYISLNKACLKYRGKKLNEVLLEKGVHFGERGRGTKYIFSDGECTTSMSEYLFSKYLRERGYKFGIDYIRDVMYSNFIQSYKGNMNCDYVIFYKGRTIYIEIAGILMEYKKQYYQEQSLPNSKSKESYRVKLKKKEKMLMSAGLEYYILFPCDLTENNLDMILFSKNPNKTRKIIESFNKTYIDWEKVNKIGELKYDYLTCYQI